jgi:hypothetical protein
MRSDLGFYLIDHRLIALAMLMVLAAACEVGYRAGSRKQAASDSFRSLMNGIGAATLGLLGLLLGFTLSMAIARWDARRDVIVNESNAIGTLWLRGGLLDEPLRNELRDALREYTDARIALGESRGDLDALLAARSKSEKLHTTIWSVVERIDRPGTSPATLSSLITAANELIDLHELRLASIQNYLPASLLLLLLGMATIAVGFLAWSFGATGQGGRAAMLLLALLIATVLALIMDVNRPQRGSIGVGVSTLERVQESIAP